MIAIADVLKVIDRVPLSAFPWGEELVTIVNAYSNSDHQLTINDTGDRLIAIIEILPPDIRRFLLTREIRRMGYITPPVTPPDSPDIVIPVQFPIGYVRSYRPVVTFLIGATLVVISGIICLNVAIKTDHARGMPPAETNILLRYASDVLRTVSRDINNEDSTKPQEGRGGQVTPNPPKDTTGPTREPPSASSAVSDTN